MGRHSTGAWAATGVLRRTAAGLGIALAGCTAQGAEPDGWVHVPINASKPRTVYQADRVREPRTVHAHADRSASLLMRPGSGVDLEATPLVEWRWRVLRAPAEPDPSIAARDDAAARLIFAFDGDRSRLPWTDRVVMALADRLGSKPLPFATLMYVVSAGHPEGTVLPNAYTPRVQMLVVDNLPGGSPSAWTAFRRDLKADFQRVFGEAPGPLLAWGLMTDSDNTRSAAEAMYELPRFVARVR